MKEDLINQYSQTLINIYPKKYLKNCLYDYIVVLKNQENPIEKNNILYTNYQDFFKHDYLIYPIPVYRKPHKLLTYQESMTILNNMNYGSLAITNDIPYCVSLNHFVVDQHIYFHCGQQGYKLKGLNQLACYHVVEDLGIHQEAFTNNHNSVVVYGILKEVKKNKKALLEAFLKRFTPDFTKDLTVQAIENTKILELEIIHITGKKHFH